MTNHSELLGDQDSPLVTEELAPSKSARKRAMARLQDLGERLVSCRAPALRASGLPEDLLSAVLECQAMPRGPALKRQRQYIGKLMREVDEAAVLAFLDGAPVRARAAAVEPDFSLVDALLAGGDAALQDLLQRHPDGDRNHLRRMLREAAKSTDDGAARRRMADYLAQIGAAVSG